ncbi:adaptin N terminal region-domain-containing protein [Entophlyctis helioformis]|nr:adaptin N terminal region-domain-containing protein [Entophlyctis helioformis]
MTLLLLLPLLALLVLLASPSQQLLLLCRRCPTAANHAVWFSVWLPCFPLFDSATTPQHATKRNATTRGWPSLTGKVQELREDLALDKKDAKQSRRRHALKKVVANMTMGNDMSPLFHDVLGCMNMPVLEIKKMVYLYLITYGKHKPDMALSAVGTLSRDAMDENPLIRALALRTFGNIPVEKVSESLCETLRRSLTDKDPYVCKTAALCVAKLFFYNESLAQREGFLGQLKSLLNHDNPTVVANALAALMDISARSKNVDFRLDVALANKLLSALDECNEWSQIYILESIMTVVPDDPNDAELLADRISPRLQHSNSAVVLTAIRIMLYLSNYIRNEAVVLSTFKKLGPPLVTLLHNTPEVQYVALRNILLVLQRQPDFLHSDLKVFFCKYNDPIYVKLAKLEIMFRLTTDKNIDIVLPELKEYAAEVDVDFVRKAVRSIGRCAIKIEKSSDKCIEALVDLVATKVNYVVQEAIVVIKDIFRKYPNRYESIIGTLCENLDSLDEPEAKASMIWIIGQYSDRIENADELLIQFLDTFKEDTAEVQLSLLTAIVKLFIKRPAVGQDLVPKVLKFATEEVDNPDLRDRGFIYWRLLSTDPVAAKAIILSDKPPITTESDNMDGGLLNQLLYNVSTLASLTHRPPAMPAGLLTRLSKFRTATFTSTGTPTSDNASASGSPSKPSA